MECENTYDHDGANGKGLGEAAGDPDAGRAPDLRGAVEADAAVRRARPASWGSPPAALASLRRLAAAKASLRRLAAALCSRVAAAADASRNGADSATAAADALSGAALAAASPLLRALLPPAAAANCSVASEGDDEPRHAAVFVLKAARAAGGLDAVAGLLLRLPRQELPWLPRGALAAAQVGAAAGLTLADPFRRLGPLPHHHAALCAGVLHAVATGNVADLAAATATTAATSTGAALATGSRL
jgi:hypothetical protein